MIRNQSRVMPTRDGSKSYVAQDHLIPTDSHSNHRRYTSSIDSTTHLPQPPTAVHLPSHTTKYVPSAQRAPARDASVSQRYECVDRDDVRYFLEVALLEDQSSADPSLVLRVTTNYGIDGITLDEPRRNVSGSGVWGGASTGSLRADGTRVGREQICGTNIYLHWGLGHDEIWEWKLPKRPFRDRLSSCHQISEDGLAVRSRFHCSSPDPLNSRHSTRNKSSAQISDSSEDHSSRRSFGRNLSQYVLAQSALTNAECRDLYYQRLAIGSTGILRTAPKSIDVFIPLGAIINAPKSFQFVLHDVRRNTWLNPDPSNLSVQPIFHISSSGVKVFSPPLWSEPLILDRNFFFPIHRALRIFILLRFRAFVGAMRPPPTLYRQLDLRPNINASIDVGVWPAIEPYKDDSQGSTRHTGHLISCWYQLMDQLYFNVSTIVPYRMAM